MINKITKILKSFVDILKKPEMKILPGHLAFYLFMSLIPIIALAFLIASFFIDSFNLPELTANLPLGFNDIIESVVISAKSYDNFLILLVFYIILASNGPSAIITASNALYDVKSCSYWKSKVKSIVMTLVLIVLILFLLLIPIFGETLVAYFLKFLNSSQQVFIENIFPICKWLVSMLFMFILFKIIYKMAPDRKIFFRSTTIGALFTSFSWLIATEGFVFYVTKIAKYNLLYGNFAHILVLLLWIYLLAYLFVVGMALNRNWELKEDMLLKK